MVGDFDNEIAFQNGPTATVGGAERFRLRSPASSEWTISSQGLIVDGRNLDSSRRFQGGDRSLSGKQSPALIHQSVFARFQSMGKRIDHTQRKPSPVVRSPFTDSRRRCDEQ